MCAIIRFRFIINEGQVNIIDETLVVLSSLFAARQSKQ